MRSARRIDVAKCDDPFWTGCKNQAAFKRIRKNDLNQDDPVYLCEECFMRMEDNDSFNPDEWVKMVC